MNQKIFQINNLHFYFRILFNDNKLFDLSFSENKNDLMERQLSLKINKNSSSKFAKEVQNQLNAYFARKLKKFDIPVHIEGCLLYTSPSPRDLAVSRMPSSA